MRFRYDQPFRLQQSIMNKPYLKGIVPILLTPFDSNGKIDKSSLCNEIEFCIHTGVDGLGIALGSEIYKLNEKD